MLNKCFLPGKRWFWGGLTAHKCLLCGQCGAFLGLIVGAGAELFHQVKRC